MDIGCRDVGHLNMDHLHLHLPFSYGTLALAKGTVAHGMFALAHAAFENGPLGCRELGWNTIMRHADHVDMPYLDVEHEMFNTWKSNT
jgi:acyl dehydratase